MYYEDIFRELNKRRVKYLVVGGIALVLHGVVRLTVDLDLMVYLDEKNLIKFINALEFLGYKPKVPVRALDLVDPKNRERGMKVFSFYQPKKPFEIIDIFIDEPIDFNKAYNNRKMIRVKDINIPIVAIEDLKKLKSISAREQDIADIKALDELEGIKNEKRKEGGILFYSRQGKIRTNI